ncbi:hypothetical protein [Salinicola rhizosphaerae]|uniref:DUF4168 domain-containing protein n=1 Tax=Salinicola rhizosphaerae TaxID=1443141 RepID=A0ABQ3DNX8_9GAMM|nr:hypothetical protein [Salinicola rhizosphaerae]GHB09799.1 hypothetical protein GCM10009038_04300 [Salinicola rhizosphaerae]
MIDFKKTLLFTVAGAIAATSAMASAAEPTCSADALKQAVTQQTQQIDSYLSQSSNPQKTQQEMASMARGLRESGQVSDHSQEMQKLASGESFEPSQAFCDDLHTTMDAVQTYMEQHPN